MSSNENNDSWLESTKEAIIGGVTGLFGYATGGLDWVLGIVTAPVPDQVLGAIWANVPTLFTFVSVARSEFQGFLLSFMSQQALTTLSVGAGVLFLLYLTDRGFDRFRDRLT